MRFWEEQLFHSGHSKAGSPVDKNKTGQQERVFRLHHGKRQGRRQHPWKYLLWVTVQSISNHLWKKSQNVPLRRQEHLKYSELVPKLPCRHTSTKGSGAGEDVDRMVEATKLAQEAAPELAIDGELQFDAAVSPAVAEKKCKGSKVAGQANGIHFP